MENKDNAVAPIMPQQIAPLGVFSSMESFELAQRMAKMLAASSLVPTQYQDSIPNAMIALEMAQRIGANPLMVMQNLYVVHGRPAWSSQFLISCVNSCGRFSALRYEVTGKEGSDDRSCVAWATEIKSGQRLESPAVSIGMAKKEGWFQKNGSKWQTMPELMLRYRAATFWARTYAPELTMGMHTQDEIADIEAKEIPVREVITPKEDPLAPGRTSIRKPKAKPEAAPKEEEAASTEPSLMDKVNEAISAAGSGIAAAYVKERGKGVDEMDELELKELLKRYSNA